MTNKKEKFEKIADYIKREQNSRFVGRLLCFFKLTGFFFSDHESYGQSF